MKGLFSTIVLFIAHLTTLVHGVSASNEFITGSRSTRRVLLQEPGSIDSGSFEDFKSSCELQGPFPYVVSLRGVNQNHTCGGTLITPTHVLTSASCVDTRAGLRNIVTHPTLFIGGFKTDEPIEIRQTVDVHFAPGWRGDKTQGSDLAILAFKKPTCIRPIPFLGRAYYSYNNNNNSNTNNYSNERSLFLVGNGREGEGDAPFNVLKAVANMTEVPLARCLLSRLKGTTQILERCFWNPHCSCASACEGDEGAPIISIQSFRNFTDRLISVISRSKGPCASPESFAIATDIDAYKPWLYRIIPALAETKFPESDH